jgi:hypothetical protein
MAPAKLDALVQLSVGMAVTPGGYAVLLGSGVSMEAGIPTGEQVLRDTMLRLYRAQNEGDPPGDDELKKWTEDEGLATLTYSDLLESIFPSAQGRRDYLTGFFRAKAPGPTHLALADLAAEGLIRIFITTNFDPLLEHALQAKGLAPVMVSDAGSIERAPARETVDCFVVKAHGDAGQLTVRNTLAEIGTLETRMEQELAEICERHGILTLGYSGNDPAVGKALERTSQNFGLYWGTRRPEISDGAKAIISATQGKLVVRPGAHELVDELARRIAAWQEHPTGETPTSVRAEMIERLRASDRVGVAELAKAERLHFEVNSIELIGEAAEEFGSSNPVGSSKLKALEADLAALFERKLASGFALIEHGGDFQAEVDWLAQLSAREIRMRSGSPTAWIQAPRWLAWMLVWAYGALAVSIREFSAVKALWETQEPAYEAEPLAAMLQGGGAQFRAWMEITRSKQMPGDGAWYLAFALAGSDFVAEHYPELIRGPDGDNVLGVLSSIGDLAYFLAALGGRGGIQTPNYWRMPQVTPHLALIMERDQRLQTQLIDLFDPEPGTEDEIVSQIQGWRKRNPEAPL